MAKLIEASNSEPRDLYKLLIGVIGPRPIGWISSVSSEGKHNLAPYSFFNMVSMNPSVLLFSGALNREGAQKDSVRNAEDTKCFVHNVVTRDIVEPMNATSEAFTYGVSEFEKVGLTPLESKHVQAPRVKEAAVSVECRYMRTLSLGDKPGNGQVVFGEVLAVHINDESLLAEDSLIDSAKLELIGRLGRTDYMDFGRPFSSSRP